MVETGIIHLPAAGDTIVVSGNGTNKAVIRCTSCQAMAGLNEAPEVTIRGHVLRVNEWNPDGKGRKKTDCSGALEWEAPKNSRMAYERVIFNPPATVVLWKDGTKTVVKCDGRDEFDPKYGMALCFMKKALGNTSRGLNDVLHREFPNVAEDGEDE